MKSKSVVLSASVLAAVVAVASGAEITAVGNPVSVDLRTDGVIGVVDTAKIRYSPKWTDGSASVRIEAVSGGTTNLIKSCTAGEEGTFLWSRPENGGPVYKLVMRTVVGDTAIGEPLTGTVSFGFRSESGASAAVDTCSGSLQTAVEAGSGVTLTYSTAWEEAAASVEIGAIRLSGKDGREMGTNTVFSAVADAEGSVALCGIGPGYWKLLCLAKDSSGRTLLEYQTDAFKRKCGFMFCIR